MLRKCIIIVKLSFHLASLANIYLLLYACPLMTPCILVTVEGSMNFCLIFEQVLRKMPEQIK